VHLLAAQIERLGPRAARGLLRAALIVLPAAQRVEQFDEWDDHLCGTDEGLHSLIVATGLVVRGLPRLAWRARTLQLFDALVPINIAVGLVSSRDGKTGAWSSSELTSLKFFAARSLRGGKHLGSVMIVYSVAVLPGRAPEITRKVIPVERFGARIVAGLVRRTGYLSVDRHFEEAYFYGVDEAEETCCWRLDGTLRSSTRMR
jgi:hypothetical protein